MAKKASRKPATVGRNLIISSSQTIANYLSDIQDAFFFVTNSVLFIVSQIMSAPCSLWFFRQVAGVGLAAIFFAVVMETAGGYASWELQRRKRDNAMCAKKWRLPVTLCWIATITSVVVEGFIIWAYMVEHGTTLKLLEQLGITDNSLFVSLGYMLSMVGVLVIGLHGQRIFWNLQMKGEMAALAGMTDAGGQELTVDVVQGTPLPECVEPAPNAPPVVREAQTSVAAGLTRKDITPLVLQVIKEHPELMTSPTRICRRIGIPTGKRALVGRIVKAHRMTQDVAT